MHSDNDIATLHRRALGATGSIVASIQPDQWLDPTPCDGWNVHDLVNHLVAGNRWAAELASGRTIADVGMRLEGDLLGSTPPQAYEESARAAAAAFEQPGALEASCAVSYGPVSGEVYAGHRFVDVLLHGWDLAIATAQPATLDPTLIASCWQVIEPQLAGLQSSGAFGTPTAAPADCDAQTRLLLALGRDPTP